VRMFRPAQDALIARRVGDIELGLHAHKDYLESQGSPKSIAALADHALIGFDKETAFIRQFQDQYPWFSRSLLAFRSDSSLAQLAAIRAGFGIGICQSALAAKDQSLQRLMRKQFSIKLETWIAMHEDLRQSPRCMVTFAALVAGLTAYIQG